MKVVHYIPTIDRNFGGTTFYMQLLGNELGKLVELHIITHSSSHPVEIKNSIVHTIAEFKYYRIMKRQFKTLLQTINPDVYHVNGCWTPSCAFTQKWAQEMGYKVIITPHGMLEPWILARHYWTRKIPALLLYQKRAIRKSNYLHATAESERENLLKLGYNNKVVVVANGIEVDDIMIKSTWTKKYKILFLSRVHVKKGIELLIEASARIKEQLKDYQIIIAGEGQEDYVQELRDKTTKMGVNTLFDFCGGVYGEDKWNLYRSADLFVLPTFAENFGLVIAEALACGTPVLTTKGTPWKELEELKCGWWIDINVESLVLALEHFLQLSESSLKVMGTTGRKLIEEKYASEKMAQRMMDLYKII
ncbi:Glycosyl transferases group 1 [Bacteroides finegoldii]|uniref:Glycosyltransferase subfamily 4-like N-terminal domain-containing protein n=1 Tax=Bacteroides finegoldii CL09T03C10 TaxID=997888 RepID=K5CPH5_9BACE|nr:glycosyltransferase [Bacteroides finegoldii]EKJ91711.1 hypothetical protein HMPREF1057_00546 [Bacteroides finegoldii CL09T03C10]